MRVTHERRFGFLSAGLMIAGILSLAACAGDDARNLVLGKYTMAVATDPPVPQVGDDVELTARFLKPDTALGACQVALRQYMPEHAMASDKAWHQMEHLGKGLFRGRSGEFTMGGKWELEFKLTCAGDEQRAALPYVLEWPE